MKVFTYWAVALVSLFTAVHSAKAQSPIGVSVMITPPYSPYISDYVYNAGKLIITLQNKTGQSRTVKLKISVSSTNGISVSTKDGFKPPQPITLSANQIRTLGVFDYQKYLDNKNISYTGFNTKDLANGAALPEGTYNFCIQVLDYNTGQLLSDGAPLSCAAPFVISYPEPPTPLNPACNSEVTSKQPQTILFNWLPSIGAPPATKYSFTIKECPTGINPNDIINNNAYPSLFNQENIAGTSLVYDAGKPQLKVGKKYVYRIKASVPGQKFFFKQDGFSSACTFTYTQAFVAPPALSPISLIAPANNGALERVIEQDQQLYVFRWNAPENLTKIGYHVKFCKIKPHQSPEQAIKENFDENMDEKGDVYKSPFKYKSKISPGKYAWQVSTNDYEQTKVKRSFVWVFTIPEPAEEANFNSFEMCGYTINISSLSNKATSELSGTGYLFLKKGGNKLNIKFNNLVVRNFKPSGGKKAPGGNLKTDGYWRCVLGTIESELPMAKPFALQPNAGIGGDFSVTPNHLVLQSKMKNKFDAAQNCYIDLTGEKENSYDRYVTAEIKWITPYSNLNKETVNTPWGKTSITVTVPVEVIASSGNLAIYDVDNFYLNGTLKSNTGASTKPDYPKNSTLTIKPGAEFNVVGNKVYIKISGDFSIPDGRIMYKAKGNTYKYLHYQFQNQTSLLIKAKLDEGAFDLPVNNDETVQLHIDEEAFIKLGSESPFGYNGSNYGVILLYPKLKLKTTEKEQTFTGKYAINSGEGFYMSDNSQQSENLKICAFKTTMKEFSVKMNKSKLTQLTLKGDIHVPFINAKAPFVFSASENGIEEGYIELDYAETTIYEKEENKVTFKPALATLNENVVEVEGDLKFSNTAGKNLSLSGITLKGLKIYADGDIKLKKDPTVLSKQVWGYFNGFIYKAATVSVSSSPGGSLESKKYFINLTGQVVLEETTLGTGSNMPVSYAFEQHIGGPKTFTDGLVASTGNESIDAYYNNVTFGNLEVGSGKVKAGFKNGSIDFNGYFEFFHNDPVYGTGFLTENSVGITTPCEGTVNMKMYVGKKTGYKYWFVEAGQKNVVQFPTGILDIAVYGFAGRFYYHMAHNDGGDINGNDYVPSNQIGFGAYARLDLKTGSNNGQTMWGPLSTEITTHAGGGLKEIRIHGNAELLSSGADQNDGMARGYADLVYNHTNPTYLQGTVGVTGNVYNQLSFGGELNFYFSDSNWYINIGTKASPVWVNAIPLGQEMSGYFGITKDGGNAKITAGVSGSIFEAHPGTSGCLIDCIAGCCCSAGVGADVSLTGAVDAFAVIPDFQIGGSVTLHASAGVYAQACGIGIHPTIHANFTGSFTMPSPFCVGGSASLVTPEPFPNIDFSARFKDGSISLGESACF